MVSIFVFLVFILTHTIASRAASLSQIELLRRQSQPSLPLDIPPQCQSLCGPPQSTLSTCSPPVPACLCSKTFQSGLFNCFSCIGKSINATDYTTPQNDVDQVTTACDQSGNPLPKLTFPGQNPKRPLSTSATAKGVTSTSQRHASSSTQASTTRPASTPSISPSPQPSATTEVAPPSIGNTAATTATGPAGSAAATTTAASSTSGNIGFCEGMNTLWVMIVAVLVGTAVL